MNTCKQVDIDSLRILGYTREEYAWLAALYGLAEGSDPFDVLADLRRQHLKTTGDARIGILTRVFTSGNPAAYCVFDDAVERLIKEEILKYE